MIQDKQTNDISDNIVSDDESSSLADEVDGTEDMLEI